MTVPYEHTEFVLLREETARGILRVLSDQPLKGELAVYVMELIAALGITLKQLHEEY